MLCDFLFFFFNDTATTEIYTLSLHDALPICRPERLVERAELRRAADRGAARARQAVDQGVGMQQPIDRARVGVVRSEEHTSELQSRQYLVCRLLLEKKKKQTI